MMKKECKILIFVFDVFNLVLFTITTYFMATLNTEFTSAGNIIQLFFTNWNNSYIQEITISESIICPNSFEPLVLDNFPGIVEGCDCTNGTNITTKLLRDKCQIDNSSVLPNNCLPVVPVTNKNYYFWKSKVICIKRATTKYLDLLIIGKSSACPENTKDCGRIDTRNDNKLCLNMNADCPIKDIKIIGINEQPKDRYSKINFNDYNSLTYSKNIEFPAISQFQISEGQNCINPAEKNSIGEPYKLLLNYYDYPCKSIINNNLFDSRFTEVSKETRTDLYKENNISFIENLPLYPKEISALTSVTLYYLPFIGINPFCKDPTTSNYINNLLELNNNYDWISYAHLFQYIVSIVSLSFFSIGFFLSLTRSYQQTSYIIQFYIMMIVLSVLHVIPNSISFKYSSIMTDTLKSGNTNDCFDSITNLQFDFFSEQFFSIKIKLIVTIVFISTQLGLFLFVVLILIFIIK